jgi:hypothetical protein
MNPKPDPRCLPIEDRYPWIPIDPPPCKDLFKCDPQFTTLAIGEEGDDPFSDIMSLDPLDSLLL